MPPKSEEPLTPEELALIKLWIDQGAKAPTGARERPKVDRRRRRRPTCTRCWASPSAPTRRPSPPRAATRSTSTTPARGTLHPHAWSIRNLTTPDKKPVKAAHCRWSSRWPTVPTASTSPAAVSRKSSCGTPQTGDAAAEADRLRRPRRGPGLLARQQTAGHRRRRADRGRRDQDLRVAERQAGRRHQERPQRHGLRRLLQPRRQDAGHLRRRQVRQDVGGAQRQVRQVVRGPHAPRPRRRLEGGRQAAGHRRRRQRRQDLGLREGRAGPHHQRATASR